MNLIEHTSQWAHGDAIQGRIMLFVGILAIIAAVAIFRSDHTILKGMLIPIALFAAAYSGYGGFLAFSRDGHYQNVKAVYAENPQQAIDQELEKAQRDNKAYSMAQRLWPILMVAALLMFFFVQRDYLRGLSLGLMGLFFSILILDVFLHHRLKPYLEVLTSMNN